MSDVNLSANLNINFSQGEEEKPYDFELIGYTGKVMEKMGWKGMFDINGMKAKDDKVIILREHERDRIVGHGETFVDERGFGVRGTFSKTTKDGIEVAGLLSEGTPLQCSVGISPVTSRDSESGEMVNNFSVPGGIEVWDQSYVGEISICTWGVDTSTSVHSFAKEIEMEDTAAVVEEEIIETEEVIHEETTDEKDGEKAAAEEVEEEKDEVCEVGEDKELKFSASDMEAAVSAERGRIASIFAADAPIELTKKAISDGMSEGLAFKFFWESEKGIKTTGLAEMAAEAPTLDSNKSSADDISEKELSYMDLIAQTKKEKKFSSTEATKYVMKNHPEAYTKFMGR